jgi:hypothetical protein
MSSSGGGRRSFGPASASSMLNHMVQNSMRLQGVPMMGSLSNEAQHLNDLRLLVASTYFIIMTHGICHTPTTPM